MSSMALNTDEYTERIEEDEEIEEWHRMSQYKLKMKITDNLKKRAINLAKAINDGLKHLIENTQSNHIWSALFPNESIEKYPDIFPLFTIPQQTIDETLNEILKKVDEWPGVDISAMNERPKDFKSYHHRADNWWNRYKAEWIGDYFFYPLLQNNLYGYIIRLTHQYTSSAYNKAVTSQQRVEYEQHVTNELLYFIALRKALYVEVRFNRSRDHPLILDQTFIKSECLQQLFAYLGHQHNVEWNIPPNHNKNKKKGLHIRHCAREWVEKILTKKAAIYDAEVMRIGVAVDIHHKHDDNIIDITDDIKCDNNNRNDNVIEPQKPPQPTSMQSSYDNVNFSDNIPPPISTHQQSTATSSISSFNSIKPTLSGSLPFNTNNGNNTVNNGTNTRSLYFNHQTGRIMPQNNNALISNMNNTVINGMNNNVSISDHRFNQNNNNISITNMNNDNNPSKSYQSAATNSVFSQQPQQYYNITTQQQPMMHIFGQQSINNHNWNGRKSPEYDIQTIHSNISHNSRQSGSTHNTVSTIAASISHNNPSQPQLSAYCTISEPYRPCRGTPIHSRQYRSHPFHVPSHLSSTPHRIYAPQIATNTQYIQQQQPQTIAANINTNASSFCSIPNTMKVDINQTVNNTYSPYNAESIYSPSNHETSTYHLPQTSMEDTQISSFESESRDRSQSSIFEYDAIYDEEEFNENFPSIDNESNGLDLFN